MDFEKIMQDITSGLTGDADHDIVYLKDRCERYKDHSTGQYTGIIIFLWQAFC